MADIQSRCGFKCGACTTTCASRKEVIDHLQRNHTVVASCLICSKQFKNRKLLNMHLASHIVDLSLNTSESITDLSPSQLRKTSNLELVKGLCLKLSNSEICKRIATKNNMVSKSVPGDGSCQYGSVIIALQSLNYPKPMSIKDLRNIAHNEILSNVSFYANYTNQDILKYASGVLDKAWGDEVTILAICNALNICTHIYSFTMLSQHVTTVGNPNSSTHIFLTLDNRISPIAHYGALISQQTANNSESTIVPCNYLNRTYADVLRSNMSKIPTLCDDEFDKKIDSDTESVASASSMLPSNLEHQRSSRLNRTYADVVRSNMPKIQCLHCKKYFVNIEQHKKCSIRKATDISDTESIISITSVASNESSRRRSSRIAEKVNEKPLDRTLDIKKSAVNQKQQCNFCKRYFCDISRHKKCPKQANFPTEKDNVKPIVSTANSTVLPSAPLVGKITNRTGNTSPSKSGSCRKQFIAINEKAALKTLTEKNHPYKTISSDDPNYKQLKEYHDYLNATVENITTQKISAEVAEIIDAEAMRERVNACENKPYSWSKCDEAKLTNLTEMAKTLKCPNWPWNADESTSQGKYNESRFRFLVEEQLKYKILKCPQCSVTTLLVGLDEIYAEKCLQCLELNRKSASNREVYENAWAKVKPADVVPDLPKLNPAEKAVIAIVQPVVTIKRNFIFNKKYKQECINLLHNAQNTWCKILPRADLKDRFVIIERRFKNSVESKYMVANPDKVRTWLRYLFKNHSVYSRKLSSGEIQLSEEALQILEKESELASVDVIEEDSDSMQVDNVEQPPPSAELDSGLSKQESYSFDNNDFLYLKKQHALKVSKDGKIGLIPDDGPLRKPVYDPHVPTSVVFPTLYPHGEEAPTDCGQHTLARWLLRKQCQFAQTTADDKLQFSHAEDGIHLMHQYARIVEMDVHGTVGWYLNLHPENSHIPAQSLLDAFKEGMNHDEGAVDRKLPDLQGVMAQMRNSREKLFSERLGIESISRDTSDANVFFTLNTDPRAWEDVRRLLFELNEGPGKEMPSDYFEIDTQKFTNLLDKFATQVTVYLCKKARLFMRAFFDICRIPESECSPDCTAPKDRTETGWYWSRVEFTQTRGVPHWHCIAKLPGVLDTAVLSRMIQNMRVVRNEIKYGNVKDVDRAWHMIKMGLLAYRYLVVFADSVSTSAFFTDNLSSDQYDESKVIDLNVIRSQFVADYTVKNINKRTHPIMRQFNDTECDSNDNREMANVAAVSCMHNCIESICGGNKFGKNCRFSFPLKLLKYTVVAVLEVTDNQMEVQILHRRTNDRIPNLQKFFLKYWRANHDFTVLADAAHKMRYVTKYVSKSSQSETLLHDVIENIEQRQSSIIPLKTKQVLSQLLLADCSHRAYLTKQQLAYYVMDLPQITRSFAAVKVVGHYPRATIIEPIDETKRDSYEFSDRTDYSAYSERCDDNTLAAGGLTKAELSAMCLREFCESINFKWVDQNKKKSKDDKNDEDETETRPRKYKCREKKSGHWLMSKKKKAVHVRSSTLLYADDARNYKPDDDVERFFDLTRDQQMLLKRVYQELVMYVPWKDDPDKSFLAAEVIDSLKNDTNDRDRDGRYSLRRLNEYWKVYMKMVRDGTVAPPGSKWWRDNQYSYTMFAASHHNRSVHQDRVAHDGVFVAQYEAADELQGTNVEIRARLSAETDNDEYPSVSSFLPSDVLEQVYQQSPPIVDELHVAFPDTSTWKDVMRNVTRRPSNLFMANPGRPDVPLSQLTPMQQHVVDLVVSGRQKLVYVYGKAGTGKTLIAQTLCANDKFVGKVQAAAGTGRAASNFNGPTIHGAFAWGVQNKYAPMSTAKKQKLQNFYEQTELFIFDEINACGADILSLIDETMKELFNPVGKDGKRIDKNRPFGGKCVVFLGDSAQLRPVGSAAIYDKSVNPVNSAAASYKSKSAKEYFMNARKGLEIYREYLVPNCVYLQQGKRNFGYLQVIMDRLRNGEQTDDDLDKLTYRRLKHPFYIAKRGIHYSNESATLFNCRQLWDECQLLNRRFYMCRASYYMTTRNDNVVRMLASVPASDFGYAPDVLCLSEGCEVRLIRNLDTSAGLVTNSTGRVVRIVYDNQDVLALLAGECPPPYCVVVSFPTFAGFISKSISEERYFPFSDETLVPVYRTRFTADKVPTQVTKLQDRSLCYREQFPIDLSTNLTAHRGQGQTWKDCTLSVNLGFESPQNKIPADAASITYVACTRITHLKHLFLSPIFPDIWKDMGKSARDSDRRAHEEDLKNKAKEFASKTGKYKECLEEMQFCESQLDVESEWLSIVSEDMTSNLESSTMMLSDSQLQTLECGLHLTDMSSIDFTVRPVYYERFIGIDQGLKTFSMVAVDRKRNCLPRIMGAFQINLIECGILDTKSKFNAANVILLLEENSPLFEWMRTSNINTDDKDKKLPDRVVVALEQISIEHAHFHQLGKNLGIALQRKVDVNKCIVKMSQPHIHRKNGPMFKLGDDIINACCLTPASYDDTKKRVERKRFLSPDPKSSDPKNTLQQGKQYSDVEPSDSEENPVTTFDVRRERSSEYRKKKKMSCDIFKYFMHATSAQQAAMQVEIDSAVQQSWVNSDTVEKYDDLGDALLHALDLVLCGSSNYRQLLPPLSVLEKNRTVAIVVLPDKVCWATTECLHNQIVIQDFGIADMPLVGLRYSHDSTVDLIRVHLPERLETALYHFDTSCGFINSTKYIKVIVKQLKQNSNKNLSAKAAGALTNAVVKTMTTISDSLLPNGVLRVDNNKKAGWLYSRKCEASGRQFVVSRSAGKHLNAVLCCLQWMKSNLPDFVRDRPLRISKDGLIAFFESLRNVALAATDANSASLESIKLNTRIIDRLKFFEGLSSSFVKKMLADLILIALNNNQQYIRGQSDNYRRNIN